ncbi:hypothetical protein L198_08089 [Cryptococcus wingfieldii CBS 7118]|uniref:Uncharacterized protein n=1 Tax=Cryptococcus wingfieldii CBS 7118 TaxID=1295528 RepID=A0A1E3HJT0_9TREE|nr:hypothetical protein L198_08089 [Cryptococcus wingfieldii CBS 7118]ODN76405.1 hypothetical protein L198_08089 [Cryptococcus wingfieldii CBS 7118]
MSKLSKFSQEEKQRGLNTMVDYASSAIQNRARALIDVQRRKRHIDETTDALSQLASIKSADGTPVADPETDYKVLTLDDAESLLLMAGIRKPGEGRGDERIPHYHNWDANTASQWSKRIHQLSDNLEARRSMYVMGNDQSGNTIKGAISAFADVLHEVSVVNDHEHDFKFKEALGFGRARHMADGLRSHLVMETTLPKIANQIHSYLSQAHSANPETLPSARSKKQKLWDQSLSEAESSIAYMGSTGWQVDPDDKAQLEQAVERSHTLLPKKSEKAVQKIEAAFLLDDYSGYYDNTTFNETRIGDLEEHLEHKLAEVAHQKFVLDDGWKKITGFPVDYVQIEQEMNEEAEAEAVQGSQQSVATLSGYGIPQDILFQPRALEFTEQKLQRLQDTFEYSSDISAYRPSAAQSHVKNIITLKSDAVSQLDAFLKAKADQVDSKDVPRSQLLDLYESKKRSLTGDRESRLKSARMTTALSRYTDIERKWENLTKSAADRILQKVADARDRLEQISQETQDIQDQSRYCRAQSDFATINALINESFQPAFDSKASKKSWLNEIQKDRTHAKSSLEKSWRLPRAASEPSLATVKEGVQTLMIDESLEIIEPSLSLGKEAEQETATARPWKSRFNWADEVEGDADTTFDEELKEWLAAEAQRNGRETAAVASTPASELHEAEPATSNVSAPVVTTNRWMRSDGKSAAQYLYEMSRASRR